MSEDADPEGDALALRAAAGDAIALRQLIGRCHERLESRIRWMMGARARRDGETLDFVQHVWTKVLADAGRLSWTSEAHFLNLVTRIARNELVNKANRPRVQRFASFTATFADAAAGAAGDPTPSADAIADETWGRLFGALGRLSADDRTVIELREFEQLSFAEIAARMGRTENAVQLLHTRAIARLGRALAP